MDLRERSKSRVGRLAALLAVLVIALMLAAPAQGASVVWTPLGSMHTGLRAAAIKKCKQRFPNGPRRTSCLKKANREPQ